MRTISPQDEEEYQESGEHDAELEDEMLACVLANENPESRGIVKGDRVWVKLPISELLALEINNSDKLSDLLDRASRLSATTGPTSDIYVTCGGKPINPKSLCALKVCKKVAIYAFTIVLGRSPRRWYTGVL